MPWMTPRQSSPGISSFRLSWAPMAMKTASNRFAISSAGTSLPTAVPVLKLDAERPDAGEIPFQDLRGEAVIGNPHGEHAAEHGQGLEHAHLVARQGQEVGRAQSRRPGTDDGDRFSRGRDFRRAAGVSGNWSIAKRLRPRILIGSSTAPRLHFSSHG